MRYYSLVLNANKEEIKENARVNLREYAYNNTFAAINNYMSQNMKNNLSFCVYREGENVIYSTFSYDQKFEEFSASYEYILEMLNEAFQIKKIVDKPKEITMYQFLDFISEGRRREYINTWKSLVEVSRLWLYNYHDGSIENLHYNFTEKIISEKSKKGTWLYDECLKKELLNIENHANNSEFNGNMVHYIISSRSSEAANDMTEVLMQSLLSAKRISGKRMEIISQIDSDIYMRCNNRLEGFYLSMKLIL